MGEVNCTLKMRKFYHQALFWSFHHASIHNITRLFSFLGIFRKLYMSVRHCPQCNLRTSRHGVWQCENRKYSTTWVVFEALSERTSYSIPPCKRQDWGNVCISSSVAWVRSFFPCAFFYPPPCCLPPPPPPHVT